jgi:hypothetical protein
LCWRLGVEVEVRSSTSHPRELLKFLAAAMQRAEPISVRHVIGRPVLISDRFRCAPSLLQKIWRLLCRQK